MDLTRDVTLGRDDIYTGPMQKLQSWLIDPNGQNYSENYNMLALSGGDVIVQVDGGSYPVGLMRRKPNGTIVWYVSTFTVAAPMDMDLTESYVYLIDLVAGTPKKMKVGKYNVATGAQVWLVDVDSGSNFSSRALAVNSDGNLWATWYNFDTNKIHKAVVRASDGVLTTNTLVTGGSAPRGYYRIQASIDRTTAYVLPYFNGTDSLSDHVDKTWTTVGWSATDYEAITKTTPATKVDAQATWCASDGGLLVQFGQKYTGSPPENRTYSVYPSMAKFSASGTLVWRTYMNNYILPDISPTMAVFGNRVYAVGFDWTAYHTTPNWDKVGLLALNEADGAFREYLKVQDDNAFLDTVGCTAGGGYLWVGGAAYGRTQYHPEGVNTYDGLAIDPAIADYGFMTVLGLPGRNTGVTIELNDAYKVPPASPGGAVGSAVISVDPSELEVRQYTEPLAKADGIDVGGVWLGARRITMQGMLYALTRGDLYDRIAIFENAMLPKSGTTGLSTLTWYLPTEGGAPVKYQLLVRPNGVRFIHSRDGQGGVDALPNAIPWFCTFTAFDPTPTVV